MLRVDGCRHGGGEGQQVATITDALEQVTTLQLVRQGHVVGRLAPLVQLDDDRVDDPVGLGVEVLGMQDRADGDDGLAVQQQRSDNRLLGLQVVRWLTGSLGRASVGGPRHLDRRNHRHTSTYR